MQKAIKLITFSFVATLLMATCSVFSFSMKQPNYRIDFTANDFDFSKQVTGEASQTRIIGIDFERLFKVSYADAMPEQISAIPVIGNIMPRTVANFALYDLLTTNGGYDVVLYPVYEIRTSGIPIIYTKTTCKVTARLGKLK